MATVSLKERMKQLQELKSSVEAKSQSVVEREKELVEIAKKSPTREGVGKLTFETTPDDETAGAETQTTAGETTASPALPQAPFNEIEEDSPTVEPTSPKHVDDEAPIETAQVDGVVPAEAVEVDDGDEDAPAEAVDEKPVEATSELLAETAGTSEYVEEEYEEVEEEEDEEVEIIEETEEVEGDAEGVEVQEVEEYVEVFEDEVDEDYEEEVINEVEKKINLSRVTDEKAADEFAWGRHPVMDTATRPIDHEEAPMDEMDFLHRAEPEPEWSSERTEPEHDSSPENTEPEPEWLSERTEPEPDPFSDDSSSELLPIFQVLDEEEGRAQIDPVVQFKDEEDTATSRSLEATSSPQPQSQSQSQPSIQTGGPQRGLDDAKDKRWKCILILLLLVGAAAVVAIVLPFKLDYGDREPKATSAPTISPQPTMFPSATPTMLPTISPAPTNAPTERPSASPTVSKAPTDSPTLNPTKNPTLEPTLFPTRAPIVATAAPTVPPTENPTGVTSAPTAPRTSFPVARPTVAPVPTLTPDSSSTLAPTTLRLGNFIEVFLIPLSGEEVFQDQSSPQFQAAVHISKDPYTNEITDTAVLGERYSLITLYYATGGPNWNRCSLGDDSCTLPWLTGTACDWAFISCNANGRVVAIDFDGEVPVGMSGFVPPELYILEEIETLKIVNEPVGGTLPDRSGPDPLNVRQWTIQGTEIGGTIPDGFLTNSPVETFVMSSNNIGGTIPLNVGDGTTLTEMNLSGNKLTGSLPGGISAYSSLTILALDSNLLVGSIPSSLYGMTSLQRLHLNNNPLLTGSLPASIGQLVSMEGLRLGQTGFGGILPSELFTLPNLVELDLRDATFRGPLPSVFVGLGDSLQLLHLQDNSFGGTIPAAFGQLITLIELNIHNNNLLGTIAPEICDLRGDALDVLTVDCDQVVCTCCTECLR